MAEAQGRPGSIHLARLLLVSAAAAFVTALIAVTDDLQTLWPLYVVPIVLGAFAYHVAGAVITSAVSAALLALLVFEADLDSSVVPELVIGMTAFMASGVVIGALAHRSQRHDEQLEQASIVDPLTGVYKLQYLHARLAEELSRSERYDLPCTLALARIDDFDGFKERFGHYKAELVLEHLADILRVTVRTIDIVARHGPIAFCILLPATDVAGAEALVDRIEAAVSKAEFEGDVLEPAVHCTASVATATYPDEAAGRSELMALAEERLSPRTADALASSAPRPEPDTDARSAHLEDDTQ